MRVTVINKFMLDIDESKIILEGETLENMLDRGALTITILEFRGIDEDGNDIEMAVTSSEDIIKILTAKANRR